MIRFLITPIYSKTRCYTFIMNFFDIITSCYNNLPVNIFIKNYNERINKQLTIDYRKKVLSKSQIIMYIKTHLLNHLVYVDKGHYKVFNLANNN